MKQLEVDLGYRSYPILIGDGILDQADILKPYISGPQVMVVSNETVAPIYLDRLVAGLPKLQVLTHVLPDGEEYKTLETLNGIFDALLAAPCDRGVTLIALGGGVVGDITGFAAACYQRGVAYIQVPTTLLAQVDSSVGGKTGVNHRLGKNMIGAFHQPRCVLADTGTLNTLEDRQLHAGIAEVIKYGLIRDPQFFTWLEENIEALLARDPAALQYAIEHSCRNKSEIVAQDEKESGIRALLNLGHTFGHAIETGIGYGQWLHGEAVAAGMCMAADLSQRIGWLAPEEAQRARRLIERAQLPVLAPGEIDADRFLELMSVDKKVQAGRLRLILLKAIGEAVITDDFDATALRDTLTACRAA